MEIQMLDCQPTVALSWKPQAEMRSRHKNPGMAPSHAQILLDVLICFLLPQMMLTQVMLSQFLILCADPFGTTKACSNRFSHALNISQKGAQDILSHKSKLLAVV